MAEAIETVSAEQAGIERPWELDGDEAIAAAEALAPLAVDDPAAVTESEGSPAR